MFVFKSSEQDYAAGDGNAYQNGDTEPQASAELATIFFAHHLLLVDFVLVVHDYSNASWLNGMRGSNFRASMR